MRYLGTHEHVEIKQHAPKKKKSMNQRRNHTQKIRIYFDERKWGQNNPKLNKYN